MTLTACGSPFESATDHSITPPKQDCCGQEDAGVGDDAPSKDETGKPPPKHDAEVADAGCTACEAGSDSPTTGSEAGSDSPTTGPEAGADSPVTTPEAGSDSPEAGSDSPITGPEAGSDSPITNPEAGSDSPITSPEAGSDSPTTGPEAGGDTYVPPVNLITNGDWSVSNGTITTPGGGEICVTTTANNTQLVWAGLVALKLQYSASPINLYFQLQRSSERTCTQYRRQNRDRPPRRTQPTSRQRLPAMPSPRPSRHSRIRSPRPLPATTQRAWLSPSQRTEASPVQRFKSASRTSASSPARTMWGCRAFRPPTRTCRGSY
jgi:hypothetical protein